MVHSNGFTPSLREDSDLLFLISLNKDPLVGLILGWDISPETHSAAGMSREREWDRSYKRCPPSTLSPGEKG